MQKKLLITFDYELFLGNRSGNIRECLLEPTNKIIDVIDRFNAKAVFFVDTTYLLTLKKNFDKYAVCQNDFNTVASQLQDLIKRGHYVFPHIHPHWLDAVYLEKTNEWQLNSLAHYRFHNTPGKDREFVFDESIKVLKEIILPVKPDYLINAYRAGGWCIQPFSDFQPFFKKHNFKYEFSVLGNIYLFSNVQYFDFSEAPVKEIYRFEDDVILENTNGQFTEFNISSIKIGSGLKFRNKILLKILHKLFNDQSYSRGEGQKASRLEGEIKQRPLRGHDINDSDYERVAIELLTAVKMKTYWDFFKEHNYMHFISHPKMLINHHIKMFDKFLGRAFSCFEVETDFKKML